MEWFAYQKSGDTATDCTTGGLVRSAGGRYDPGSREAVGMNRRSFVTSLAAIIAAPLRAKAQSAGRTYRIGWLSSGSTPTLDLQSGFVDALREMGYHDGRNLVIKAHYAAGNPERLRTYAQELITLGPDAIVTFGTPASLAAKQATTSVPIIMLAVGDPVGSGLVPTLSKPGGNVTGVSAAFGDLAPKYVDLLRQLRPGISQIGFLGNAENPVNARTVFPAVQAATSTVGGAAEYFSATKPSEVPVALQAIARSGIQGLIVSADPVIRSRTAEIAQFVAKARVPSISFADDYVRAGGLLSYGPNPRDLGRHAAVYVSKIFGGAKPADLPIEQPTKFELVINMTTARALGLTIPPSLLLRADQVIE